MVATDTTTVRWARSLSLYFVCAAAACGTSTSSEDTGFESEGVTSLTTFDASGSSADESGEASDSGEATTGDKLDVNLTDLPGGTDGTDSGSIDETTCAGAAEALTSAGCLFAPIVGNTTGTLPWAVIAANTNDMPAQVDLIDPTGTLLDSVSVPGRDLHVFELTGTQTQQWAHASSTSVNNLVFRLESDRPIVAYQYQPYSQSQNATADGSLLLPEHAWSDNYLTVNQSAGGDNWITVVSLEDGNEVTVRRPASAAGSTSGGGGIPALSAGQSHTQTLNAQQSMRIHAGTTTDQSGTQVFTAGGKVAVFVGSSGMNIPSGVSWKDLLEEQVAPRSAWGTEYAVVKFQPRSNEPDTYKIIADKDGTTVNISGGFTQSYTLNEGEFAEFSTPANFKVEANEAILLAHFLQSANSNTGDKDPTLFPGPYEATQNCNTSVSATDLGDPLISFVAPVDQFRQRYTFLTPFTYAWDMVTVVAPSAGWGSIQIDGNPLPAPTPLGVDDLSFARFLVEDGAHFIASDSTKFGIEVYGYDCRISYGYAGGLSLGVINIPPPPQG